MANISHGVWELYVPVSTPEGAPGSAIYAKRVSDGKDWYEYLKENPFQPSSAKVVVVDMRDEEGVITATAAGAVIDPSRLFPAGQEVVEVTDYQGPIDPQMSFERRTYDRRARKFGPPLELKVSSIEQRLAALEAKLKTSKGP